MKNKKWILMGLVVAVLIGASVIWKIQKDRTKIPVFETYDSLRTVTQPTQITLNGEALTLAGGTFLQVGDQLSTDALKNTEGDQTVIAAQSGWKVVMSVPAIETKVCSAQTIMLNGFAKGYPDVSFYVVSQDPITTCDSFKNEHNIDSLTVLSDDERGVFARANHLYLEDKQMNARAIMILNPDNQVVYVEYAPDLGDGLDLVNVLTYLSKER